jgi:hydrogenase nickel incorporation protein HypA/HybF
LHELSVCQSMMRIVDATMEKHGGAKLLRIFLDVGRGSTIEPILLKEAFEIASCGSPYEGVELVINDIPIAGSCASCGKKFEYREMALGCPNCGSMDVTIESGLELNIRELEIDDGGS